MKRNLYLLTIFCFSLLIFQCSSDSNNPTSPNDNNNTGETAQAEIGPAGGSVKLPDGISVTFPPDAVSTSKKVTVSSLKSDVYNTNGFTYMKVIKCTGFTEIFGKPVQLAVPLKGSGIETENNNIFAAVISDGNGSMTMLPCSIQNIDDVPNIVAETEHFSIFGFWFYGEDEGENPGTPPASARLDIPIYNQGESPYCWAACIHMLTQSVPRDHSQPSQVYDIIGKLGIDAGGLTAANLVNSASLADFIKSRSNDYPERGLWLQIAHWDPWEKVRNYIKCEVGIAGRPVMIHDGTHAVVIVGYENDIFWVHDPAALGESYVGYQALLWSDLRDKLGLFTGIATFIIPTDHPDANRPVITTGITNNSLIFNKPKTTYDPNPDKFYFLWDHRKQEGYSFTNAPLDASAAGVDKLPGGIVSLDVEGIEIINSSFSDTRDVDISLMVKPVDNLENYYYNERAQTISPKNKFRVKFSDKNAIPVDEFRYNTDVPTLYELEVKAVPKGTIGDKNIIRFTIDTVTPKIEKLEPDKSGIGTEVVIRGHEFGTIPKMNTVYFGGTEVAGSDIVSWSDESITVKVPEKAQSGNVVVMRGKVASNGVLFTVVEVMTYTGTWKYEDPIVTATTTWTINGNIVIVDESPNQVFYPYYQVKVGTLVELTINVSIALARGKQVIKEDSGGYTEIIYKTPILGYTEDIFSIIGEFSHTESATDYTFTASVTFTETHQYFNCHPNYYVPYDYRTYDSQGKVIFEVLDKVDEYTQHEVAGIVITSR
ncbi:MAG: IPT/TIG domain-containing protein [Candidatus Latescibacteria bacterium]|nr:IPT/TIG domain-containing protein [Candidatus Latescibacterota bacterium]